MWHLRDIFFSDKYMANSTVKLHFVGFFTEMCNTFCLYVDYSRPAVEHVYAMW